MNLRVRTKICGLTRAEDAAAAVAAGAEAVGFVFVPGTPRYLEAEAARWIIETLPPFVAKVGLFVDADARTVSATIARTGVDTIQLHGDESMEFAGQFRGQVKVIKAFRVRGAATLEQLPAWRGVVDAWLLDAFVAGVHGGTGARFDWELAAQARDLGVPLILAGGLTPENAGEAVTRVRPYALDVSSGVESAPGKKDEVRMRRFLGAVRGAE